MFPAGLRTNSHVWLIGALATEPFWTPNILIIALITKDTLPDRLYQAWLRGESELVTSTAQIAELPNVLSRQRLQWFLDADESMAIVEDIGTLAVILDRLPSVSRSPDPNGQSDIGYGACWRREPDRLRG